MHDLDRTLQEFETGIDALESGDFEYEYEYDSESDGGGTMGEVEEMEFAAGLLEISDEQELEQFFGSLLKKAVSGARTFAGTPEGRALVGILKNAAGKALPVVGGAIGGAVGGSAGRSFGRDVGRLAKGHLGWELEGGGQDQEFETAQGLVRVATAAAKQIAQSPSGGSPVAAAKKAAITAAQQVAPQLVRIIASAGGQGGGAMARGRKSGRWIRRGNAIVLLGA